MTNLMQKGLISVTIGLSAVVCGCSTGELPLAIAYGVASISSYLQPITEKDWEVRSEFTVPPGNQNAPLVLEKTKNYIHLGKLRFKVNGKVVPVTPESLNNEAKNLLAMYPDWNRFRIAGKTFENKPIYFFDKRIFVVSVDPPVMALVPATFQSRGETLSPRLEPRYGYNEVASAYDVFFTRERKLGIYYWVGRADGWMNYLEFSWIVPEADGIEMVSAWWPEPVSLQAALADERWGFRAERPAALPGYLALMPRDASNSHIDFPKPGGQVQAPLPK